MDGDRLSDCDLDLLASGFTPTPEQTARLVAEVREQRVERDNLAIYSRDKGVVLVTLMDERDHALKELAEAKLAIEQLMGGPPDPSYTGKDGEPL